MFIINGEVYSDKEYEQEREKRRIEALNPSTVGTPALPKKEKVEKKILDALSIKIEFKDRDPVIMTEFPEESVEKKLKAGKYCPICQEKLEWRIGVLERHMQSHNVKIKGREGFVKFQKEYLDNLKGKDKK